MPFQISPLPQGQFDHLLGLSAEQLQAHNAIRTVVNEKPGFPCRISLEDAEIGEEVLLVHYEHQSGPSPFRASHAVYVRPGMKEAVLAPDQVPELLRSRVLSLRAFDQKGMMIGADLADGHSVEPVIEQLLSDDRAAYLHIHFAKPGCYAARVDRA